MIPLSTMYVEKYHDGDDEGYMVTNQFGDVLFQSDSKQAAQEFVNAA